MSHVWHPAQFIRLPGGVESRLEVKEPNPVHRRGGCRIEEADIRRGEERLSHFGWFKDPAFWTYTHTHIIYIYNIYIYISYICCQHQLLMLGTKITVIALSFFLGALSLYSALFKSTLNNTNMKQNWLYGFKSPNCWEWIKGRSAVAFATMLGSYPSTFRDSFNGSQRL